MTDKFSEVFYKPIVFEEIQRVVWPPSWLGHTPFALWLMEQLRPQIVVELGTHTGNSFCSFCQGAKYLQYSPSCYAVDTWKGDPHAGMYEEDVYLELSEYIAKNYSYFAYLIRNTFEVALSNFTDGSIDLLNIDGYHTYEATRENFESWLPKMSDKGIILIHDTNVHIDDFGAWKFWDEIKETYPSFSFLHSHGLGIVSVGSTLSENLKYLTTSDEKRITEIRKFFSSIGSTPMLRAHNEKLSARVEGPKSSEVSVSQPRKADDQAEYQQALEASLRQQASKITALLAELESLGSLNADANWLKTFVSDNFGSTYAEAKENLEAERKEAQSWKDFVQGNLAATVKEAYAKLKDLGESNLEGMQFKTFVQTHVAPTVESALEKLVALGDSNLEGMQYKDLVQRHFGSQLQEASNKIAALLKSDQLNADYKPLGRKVASFVNRKITSLIK